MSGKQAKRARHAAIVAPPVRTRGERRASPRVLVGALVAVVLIGAVVGIALAVSGGLSSSSTTTVAQTGSLTGALPGAAQVAAVYRGIPQQGNVLGSPEAPVTMVEYVDLQCPYCRSFELDAMPALVKTYVRTGKLKIEQRLLAFIGPDSVRGRLAAISAGDQNRLFGMTGLLYFHQGAENTGWLSDKLVAAAAASIPGADVPALLAGADSAQERAAASVELAKADSISSTPTILVGKTGETPEQVTLSDASDGSPVAAAIDRALQ
jgi:protein-disulfide isomerase